MALAACHALIRGLRKSSDDTALTRTLAAVFAAEPRMASDFVRLVLGVAPRRSCIDHDQLPDLLECRPEPLIAEGRADPSFVEDSRRWHVIPELKIRAGYGLIGSDTQAQNRGEPPWVREVSLAAACSNNANRMRSAIARRLDESETHE
jgi:hypothetical protein